jgi:hypothetical protein
MTLHIGPRPDAGEGEGPVGPPEPLESGRRHPHMVGESTT